jgi:hypothetical protein
MWWLLAKTDFLPTNVYNDQKVNRPWNLNIVPFTNCSQKIPGYLVEKEFSNGQNFKSYFKDL